ncbi:MAG TPA: TonB family protein [Ignavibacteriaceae bacterium]|nr:TonB family protein [Ignavibacteriaceae bacterium]
MKRFLSGLLLFYSLSLSGQKIFLDEYKATVMDSSEAKYYETVVYSSANKTFKKRTYAITGEKISEFDFIVSPNSEGIQYLWYLGIPDKKFIQNGVSMSWYKNGQLKSQLNYVNGKQEGKSLSWYNNGQLKNEIIYINGKAGGKSLSWYEDGHQKSDYNYSNNSFDGDQIIYYDNGQIKRKDKYVNGKFKTGVCYDSLGNEVKHTVQESMPIYKGGDRQLLNDIASRLQYPTRSRDAGIQGKVVVVFAVDKNGEITDREIKEGVNSELNLEAIRVIGTLKFKPGIADGEPAKVYFIVPITFTLR